MSRKSLDATLAAMAHSHAPLDSILGKLGISRSTNHHPLFQVAINYVKDSVDEIDFGNDGTIQWDGGVPGGNPYDPMLKVAAMPNSTIVSLITPRNLYSGSDGALLLMWYTRALDCLARDTYCEVGDVLSPTIPISWRP